MNAPNLATIPVNSFRSGVLQRGHVRHFLRTPVNPLNSSALCGAKPGRYSRWFDSSSLVPLADDCPTCVGRFIKLGGQFDV